MSLYNGTEFDHLTGSQGLAKKAIWKEFFSKFINYSLEIASVVGVESAARALAVQNLQSQITSMKIITGWNPANPFPAKKSDGSNFEAGNFVRITASVGDYKAGDMLIAIEDIPGDATIEHFGDVETNVELATDTFAGVVKILADKAAYEGVGNDTSVVTKVVLQQVLTALGAEITTAFQNADTALQEAITDAYTQAISTALANYYSKAEIVNLLEGKTNKADSASIVGSLKDLYASLAVVQSRIPQIGQFHSIAVMIPDLTTNMQGAFSNERTVPVALVTKEGIAQRGLILISEHVANWSEVVFARKAELDYVVIKSPTTYICQLVFNPESLTQQDVADMSVLNTYYGVVPTLEQQLAATNTNPWNRNAIGKADGSSAASLAALEAKFANVNVNI